MTPAGAYIPPPLTCQHGRQTVHCAECAPAAEERYREWKRQVAELEAKMTAEVDLLMKAREGITEASKGME